MNTEQMKNILLVVLGAVGSYFVGKGWFDSATASNLVGATITILTAAWGIYKGTAINVAINAAGTPGIGGVATTKAIADATPNNKNIVAMADAATLTHLPTT